MKNKSFDLFFVLPSRSHQKDYIYSENIRLYAAQQFLLLVTFYFVRQSGHTLYFYMALPFSKNFLMEIQYCELKKHFPFPIWGQR